MAREAAARRQVSAMRTPNRRDGRMPALFSQAGQTTRVQAVAPGREGQAAVFLARRKDWCNVTSKAAIIRSLAGKTVLDVGGASYGDTNQYETELASAWSMLGRVIRAIGAFGMMQKGHGTRTWKWTTTIIRRIGWRFHCRLAPTII